MPDSVYPAFGSPQRLVLYVLREWFKDTDYGLHIATLMPNDFDGRLPFVLVRSNQRTGNEGVRSADERFMRTVSIGIETITTGLNAENDGYELQESCRLALLWAQREQLTIPGVGSIASFIRSNDISRVSDYATSTGVVQYASLPKGAVRHEAIYQMMMRPPLGGASNKYLPSFVREGLAHGV